MRKIGFIVAGMAVCLGMNAQAQETKDAEPKGKAIVQVFSNFNADFGKDAESLGELVEYGDTTTMFSNPTDERTRAYLTGKMG